MLIDQNGAFPHAPFFLRHAVYTLHNETLLVHSISYTIRIIRNDGIEPAKKIICLPFARRPKWCVSSS